MQNKSHVFDFDYIVVGDDQNSILSPYSCITKIINISGVTKQSASKKLTDLKKKKLDDLGLNRTKSIILLMVRNKGQMRPRSLLARCTLLNIS